MLGDTHSWVVTYRPIKKSAGWNFTMTSSFLGSQLLHSKFGLPWRNGSIRQTTAPPGAKSQQTVDGVIRRRSPRAADVRIKTLPCVGRANTADRIPAVPRWFSWKSAWRAWSPLGEQLLSARIAWSCVVRSLKVVSHHLSVFYGQAFFYPFRSVVAKTPLDENTS